MDEGVVALSDRDWRLWVDNEEWGAVLFSIALTYDKDLEKVATAIDEALKLDLDLELAGYDLKKHETSTSPPRIFEDIELAKKVRGTAIILCLSEGRAYNIISEAQKLVPLFRNAVDGRGRLP